MVQPQIYNIVILADNDKNKNSNKLYLIRVYNNNDDESPKVDEILIMQAMYLNKPIIVLLWAYYEHVHNKPIIALLWAY